MMTDLEKKLINKLGEVWNDFCLLNQNKKDGGHPDDTIDFKFHVHALQTIILARVGFRLSYGDYLKGEENKHEL